MIVPILARMVEVYDSRTARSQRATVFGREMAHPELRGTGWGQCHHPNNGDQSRLKTALVWAMVADSETGGRAAGVCLSSAITAAALLTPVYTSRLIAAGGPRNQRPVLRLAKDGPASHFPRIPGAESTRKTRTGFAVTARLDSQENTRRAGRGRRTTLAGKSWGGLSRLATATVVHLGISAVRATGARLAR